MPLRHASTASVSSSAMPQIHARSPRDRILDVFHNLSRFEQGPSGHSGGPCAFLAIIYRWASHLFYN